MESTLKIQGSLTSVRNTTVPAVMDLMVWIRRTGNCCEWCSGRQFMSTDRL